MRPRPLLSRVVHGDLANVSFIDMRRLVEAYGFELSRTSGSHHIFSHPEVPELLNLQGVRARSSRTRFASFSALSSGTL